MLLNELSTPNTQKYIFSSIFVFHEFFCISTIDYERFKEKWLQSCVMENYIWNFISFVSLTAAPRMNGWSNDHNDDSTQHQIENQYPIRYETTTNENVFNKINGKIGCFLSSSLKLKAQLADHQNLSHSWIVRMDGEEFDH